MPRYELMYILASSVSDDIVEETSKEVEQFVADFGGTNIQHEMMGKKKLAYAIKKTRNGHYGLITFNASGEKINDLDAKLRTQRKNIIRHIIVNIDEHLERSEKDRIAQAKMNQARDAEKAKAAEEKAEAASKPAKKEAQSAQGGSASGRKKVSTEKIDEEIEKALSEDITK